MFGDFNININPQIVSKAGDLLQKQNHPHSKKLRLVWVKILSGFWWVLNPFILLLESVMWVFEKIRWVIGTVLSLVVRTVLSLLNVIRHPILTIAKFWAKAEQVVTKRKFRKIQSSIERTFKRVISYITISNFQYEIGEAYYYGKWVKKDLSKAFKWYQIAVKERYAPAQYSLGAMYIMGEGIEKNPTRAVRWFKKAAKQGYQEAKAHLGFVYFNGKGVDADKDEAARWYKEAAEQGSIEAQNNLGVAYEKGEGVDADKDEAARWYKEAAEQGHSIAQRNLGNMYYNGKGVEKNKKEAFKWYEKAAEQGLSPAQNNLAAMYYRGEGVFQNYIQSYKWLSLATANGYEVAPQNREELTKKLREEQIAEAQKLASEWKPTGEEPSTDKRVEISIPHIIVSGLVIVGLYPFIPEYDEVTKVINHIYCWYDNNLGQIKSDIGL